MTRSEWRPTEYEEEELLSLDRLKRAVSNRVFNRAESLVGPGEEYLLDKDKTDEIIADEWKRAKAAVRSSKRAQENLRKQWEQFVGERIESLIQADKNELSSMGVVEKSI